MFSIEDDLKTKMPYRYGNLEFFYFTFVKDEWMDVALECGQLSLSFSLGSFVNESCLVRVHYVTRFTRLDVF